MAAGRKGEAGIGEFLDGLSARTVGTLAEAGFEMGLLRHLGATEQGARQVRHIVAEFGRVPRRERALRRIGPLMAGGGVAGYWAVVLLGAALGLAATIAASVLVARLLGLVVAGVFGVALMILLLMTPDTRWREIAVLLALAATAVLLFTAFLNAPQWYLAARGKQVAATVAAPYRTWSHGSRVAYCRVRLPDGSIHQVDRNDRECAAEVGATVQVVYDPGGHVSPVLGGRQALGRISRPVAEGAGVVLLGAATGAVAAAGRRSGRGAR